MPNGKTSVWQKTETRAVRPFRSAAAYLDDVGVRFYADQDFISLESVRLDEVDLGRLAVSLRVPKLSADIEEIVGLASKDLLLVVSLEDPTFKMRELAHQSAISDFYKESQIVDLPIDIVQQMSWSGEIRIHIAVVLRQARLPEIGVATRSGSWLASKTIVVGKPRETSSFNIDPVGPEYFQARGLPVTTTYLVEIADPDLNQPCDSVQQLIKVSIAKDVYSALGRDEGSAASKAFMRSIYVDVVTTVLATGFSNLTGELEQDSILDVVCRRLSKATSVPIASLQKKASESSGAALRAVVQAEVDLSRSMINATQRRPG